MEELNKRSELINDVKSLLLELERVNIKLNESTFLNYSTIELEEQRDYLQSLLLFNKVNYSVITLENSIRKDNNLKDNLSNYLSVIYDLINKVNNVVTIKSVPYTDTITNRLCNIVYMIIKYSVIFNYDTINLIDVIKKSNVLCNYINSLIRIEISDILNLQCDYFNKEDLNKLKSSLDSDDLLNYDLIKIICDIQISYRKQIDENIIKYNEYLTERNKRIYNMLEELDNKKILKSKELIRKKNLFNKLKNSFISLVLSTSILTGVFTSVNFVSRYTFNSVHSNIENQSSDINYSYDKVKNIISFLISILATYLISYFPKVEIRKVYKKYKNLKMELKSNETDISNIHLSIIELQNEIDEFTSIDEITSKEVRDLFDYMYKVLGYYYISNEEEQMVSDMKTILNESMTLRNAFLGL